MQTLGKLGRFTLLHGPSQKRLKDHLDLFPNRLFSPAELHKETEVAKSTVYKYILEHPEDFRAVKIPGGPDRYQSIRGKAPRVVTLRKDGSVHSDGETEIWLDGSLLECPLLHILYIWEQC